MDCFNALRYSKITLLIQCALILYLVFRSLKTNDIIRTINNENGIAFDSRVYNNTSIEIISYVGVNSIRAMARHYRNTNLPSFKVSQVSCQRLRDRDEKEFELAEKIQQNLKRKHTYGQVTGTLSKDAYQSMADLSSELNNCSNYRRSHINTPVNEEEEDFAIAFSIIIYKDLDQAARLLRAIYRPQNYYCLHIDATSPEELYNTAEQMTRCFDNVFLASKRIDVVWGWYSVVAPDVLCMQDLWKYTKWKYFINLTGQEFPLKTNLEIVRILKIYNGANDIEAMPFETLSKYNQNRILYGYSDRNLFPEAGKYSLAGARKRKESFPYNISWAKGQPHIAASRAFVDYLLHDPVGIELRKWVEDTSHASEHLFNPLQLSPQLKVPGSYTGTKGLSTGHTRYKNWVDHADVPCNGMYYRGICIPSVRDLWQFQNSTKMFVNKLHATYHPLLYSCLEEQLFDHIQEDSLGDNRLNLTFYKNSDFVLHHLTVDE